MKLSLVKRTSQIRLWSSQMNSQMPKRKRMSRTFRRKKWKKREKKKPLLKRMLLIAAAVEVASAMSLT